MYTPDLDTLPKHELQRQVGLMREPDLDRALTQPEAYSAGPREQRAIQKELGWREQERIAAAQAHDDALRQAGFETGFNVDITQGIPDPIADPLPDLVVNHVDDVVDGKFQPYEIPDPPAEVVTPSTSPVEEAPFVSYDTTTPKSIKEDREGVSVKFSVSFDDGFDDKFRSKFNTK
ncbi:hypothetical protein [Halorubrum lipolyticum]|uniref:hypothetical protein n=1 Tax=Halorubrum lipolyticum TaxID=368624 RepID=UPI0011CB3075|nr:hypothetical protein [Halorubrum lipolyticum]